MEEIEKNNSEGTSENTEYDIDLEETENRLEDKIKSLRSKLTECEHSKQELHEEMQRTKADFLNSRKRMTEQLALDTMRITENILVDFLPLLDSFDTALSQKDNDNSDTNAWKKGVEVMHGQFMNLLKRYDIEEILALNTPFNPNEHDAVAERKDHGEKGLVIEVMQKGFKRNDTVLRPAKVVVSS